MIRDSTCPPQVNVSRTFVFFAMPKAFSMPPATFPVFPVLV